MAQQAKIIEVAILVGNQIIQHNHPVQGWYNVPHAEGLTTVYDVKGGSDPFQQQPFNEVIASGIMECLGIPHISYTLIWNDGRP